MAHATVAVIEAKRLNFLPNPSNNPDLAPCDFHLFRLLKDYRRGQQFKNDEAIKSAVRSWMRLSDLDFFNGFPGL